MNAAERLQHIQRMKALEKKSKQERDAAILEQREKMFAPFRKAMQELHDAGAMLMLRGKPTDKDGYGQKFEPFKMGERRWPGDELTEFTFRPESDNNITASIDKFADDGSIPEKPFLFTHRRSQYDRQPLSFRFSTVEGLVEAFLEAAAPYIHIPPAEPEVQA